MTFFDKLIGGVQEAQRHYSNPAVHAHTRDGEPLKIFVWDPDGKLDRAAMESLGWTNDPDTSDWALPVEEGCG